MGNQNQRPRDYGDFTSVAGGGSGGCRNFGGGAGGGAGGVGGCGGGSNSQCEFSSVMPESNTRRLLHNDAAVTSVAALHPGVVLSGAKDGSLALFDPYSRKTLHRWAAHDKEVTCVQHLAPKPMISATKYAPPHENPRAISSSRDKTVKLWAFGRSEPLRVMTGHALVVTSVTTNPEATLIASGSRDNSVRLWDVETGTCVAKNQTSRNLVTDLQWSPDGKFILQTSEDKEVKVFDSNDLTVVRTFPRKTQIQTCVDVSGDCRRLATASNGFGGAGCEVTLWDLAQGKVITELRGHTETTNAVRFIAVDGHPTEFLASASNDCSLRVWDLNTKETVGKLCLPGSGPLTSTTSFPDGLVVVSSFNSGIFLAKFDADPDWANQALVQTYNY